MSRSMIFGDMPNLQMPTAGGHVFWDTLIDTGKYRLQMNKFSKHTRILNKYDERIAWGSYSAMVKKLERILEDENISE